MIRRVVVSGPTGEIGLALINLLLEQQIEVLALCRPNSKRKKYIPQSPYVIIKECDLSEMSEFPTMPTKYDVFFHLGWCGSYGEERDSLYLQTQNIKYELDAVNLAEKLGCKVFVGAGTQAEYGRKDKPLTPKTSVEPEMPYGMAKLCAGWFSRLECEKKGIKHIWMRITSVYGPCDGPNTLITYMMRQLKYQQDIILTPCEQIWDYLFSKDAARAFYLVAEKGVSGKIYCLGSGKAMPLRKYIEEIQKLIDSEKLSTNIVYGGKNYGDNQMMYLSTDISELENDTGFTPNIAFGEGIKQTYHWYMKNDLI